MCVCVCVCVCKCVCVLCIDLLQTCYWGLLSWVFQHSKQENNGSKTRGLTTRMIAPCYAIIYTYIPSDGTVSQSEGRRIQRAAGKGPERG